MSEDDYSSESQQPYARHKAKDARTGFFWLHDALYDVYAKKIGVYGVAVYGLLCRRANSDAQSWPSLNGMARDLSISRSKLCTTLNELEKAKLISRYAEQDPKRGHMTTTYTVLEPLVREVDKGSPHNGQALSAERTRRNTQEKEYTLKVLGKPSKNDLRPEARERIRQMQEKGLM